MLNLKSKKESSDKTYYIATIKHYLKEGLQDELISTKPFPREEEETDRDLINRAIIHMVNEESEELYDKDKESSYFIRKKLITK